MAEPAIAVRRALPVDADAIAQIQADAWRLAYRGLVPDAFLDGMDAARSAARWRAAIEGGDCAALVAEIAGETVGFAAVAHAQDPDLAPATALEIRSLYVAPAAQRNGAGRALCAAVRRLARARSLGEVVLWVLRRNERARLFYEAVGFAPDGAARVETRLVGAPLDEVRYRRSA